MISVNAIDYQASKLIERASTMRETREETEAIHI